MAEHLFTWGGEVGIIAPEELREVMRERLASAYDALGDVRPDMTLQRSNTAQMKEQR